MTDCDSRNRIIHTTLETVYEVFFTVFSLFTEKISCKARVNCALIFQAMVDVLLQDSAKQGYIPDSSVAGDELENNMGFRPAPFMIYKNLTNLGGNLVAY